MKATVNIGDSGSDTVYTAFAADEFLESLSIHQRLAVANLCDRFGRKAKAARIRARIADQLMENLI